MPLGRPTVWRARGKTLWSHTRVRKPCSAMPSVARNPAPTRAPTTTTSIIMAFVGIVPCHSFLLAASRRPPRPPPFSPPGLRANKGQRHCCIAHGQRIAIDQQFCGWPLGCNLHRVCNAWRKVVMPTIKQNRPRHQRRERVVAKCARKKTASAAPPTMGAKGDQKNSGTRNSKAIQVFVICIAKRCSFRFFAGSKSSGAFWRSD